MCCTNLAVWNSRSVYIHIQYGQTFCGEHSAEREQNHMGHYQGPNERCVQVQGQYTYMYLFNLAKHSVAEHRLRTKRARIKLRGSLWTMCFIYLGVWIQGQYAYIFNMDKCSIEHSKQQEKIVWTIMIHQGLKWTMCCKNLEVWNSRSVHAHTCNYSIWSNVV